MQTYETAGTYSGGPAISTLVGNTDADPRLEILVTALATGSLYAWHWDGTPVSGWPLPRGAGASYPALGRFLTPGPGLQIFAGYWNQPGLAAYRGEGTLLPGWPRSSAGQVSQLPALTDVDGQGLDAIFIGENDRQLHAYRADGSLLPGWPVGGSGGNRRYPPAIGDLTGDCQPEIVTTDEANTIGVQLFAYQQDASPLAGFPVLFPQDGLSSSFPVIGDVDGDGWAEISVVERPNFGPTYLYILAHDGTIKHQVPVSGAVTYGTAPALADLDGDGRPEIIVQTESSLEVWKGDGTILPGWPQTWAGYEQGNSAPVIGDLDGDAQPDIALTRTFAGGWGGEVVAFNRQGQLLAHFPKALPLGDGAVPAMADVDADGRNELVVSGSYWDGADGWKDKVWMYDLHGSGAYGPVLWSQFGGGPSHQSRYPAGQPLCPPSPTPTGTPPTATSTPAPSPTCVPGAWQLAAQYPIPMLDAAAAAQDGQLYVFGGYPATAVAYAYNISTTIWTRLADLPAPRASARAVSDGTSIYIVNGTDSSNITQNSLYRYDPRTNSYSTLPPAPVGSAFHAVVILGDDLYRIAGCALNCFSTSRSFLSSVDRYRLSTNTWAAPGTVADYPVDLGYHNAVAVNGYVYSAGGYNNVFGLFNRTYRYDPTANSWSDAAINDLPQLRMAAAGGIVQGRWVLAGGLVNGSIDSSGVALDLANPTSSWTAVTAMPAGPRAYQAGATVGNTLAVIGGINDQGGATQDTQLYTAGACTSGTPIPTASPPPGLTPTATPVSAPTGTPTSRPAHSVTPPSEPTQTPSHPTETPLPTVCPWQFTDVPVGSPFYDYVRCLACRGIVSGYPCGEPGEPCPGLYFRPNTQVTRGQVSKIVAESAGFADVIPSSQQTFADVPPGSTFHLWVERLSTRGIIGGYPCGSPVEPCVAPGNRPYFRPNTNVTRGQLAKIVVGAAQYTETPTAQTFVDVPVGSTFYLPIERLARRGIIGGYPCGSAVEPCVAPEDRPYFRPNNPATRGQMGKIAANAFFPNCVTPARQ